VRLLSDCRSVSQSVSQSVCLGIEHPCGTCDQILFPVGMLLWGALLYKNAIRTSQETHYASTTEPNLLMLFIVRWGYFTTDGQSVSQSVSLGIEHPCGTCDQRLLFSFFCRTIPLLFVLGHLLWREDGSVMCSTICQWSESRRTHNHKLLSHLRLLGSLSVASYDSQGLQWKYSYQPPHGDSLMRGRVCNL
jgi:hypothetical protein